MAMKTKVVTLFGLCTAGIFVASQFDLGGGAKDREKNAVLVPDDGGVDNGQRHASSPDLIRIRQAVHEGKIRVTGGDGREVSEDEKVAWGAVLESSLSQALANFVVELVDSLELSGDVEAKLMRAIPYKSGDAELLTIHLLMAGELTPPPRTIEVSSQGRPFMRICRVAAPVERPIAFVTATRVDGGVARTSEVVMTYDEDCGWTVHRPTVVNRPLDD